MVKFYFFGLDLTIKYFLSVWVNVSIIFFLYSPIFLFIASSITYYRNSLLLLFSIESRTTENLNKYLQLGQHVLYTTFDFYISFNLWTGRSVFLIDCLILFLTGVTDFSRYTSDLRLSLLSYFFIIMIYYCNNHKLRPCHLSLVVNSINCRLVYMMIII